MALPFWDPTEGELASGYDTNQGIDVYPINPWDLCILDGQKLPGVARCKAKPQRKVDQKKKAGVDGSNPTVHGYDPGPVEIELTFWQPIQLRILVTLMDTYWPPLAKLFRNTDGKIKGKVQPLKIYHPELDFLRISAVLVTSVSNPKPGKVFGSREVTFYCLEYNAAIPKSVTTTPKAPKVPVRAERQILASFQPPASATQDANYSPVNATQSLPSTDANFTDPSAGP